ncbi:RagB/SusD family nutrient uptake outer membrane protein [Flavobacterium maritimum]|uniref:RagB/SusD family nutrient uptake outer membrane protein n=1 Tax=Flavobacterium maritimum TaxID=3149042 RepID=UPI0032B5164B
MKTVLKKGCFFIIIMLGSLQACTNLDEEVFSSVTESSYVLSPGDATKSLGAVYANLRPQIGFYTTYIQSITTDEAVMPANASGWNDGGIYQRMHLHSWNSAQAHLIPLWNINYKGVLLCNKLIEQLMGDEIPLSSTENKLQLIAEAKTLRAYHYWQLFDNFGDVPLVTDTSLDLPVTSPREDVYNYVIAELLEAINDLSPEKTTANYGRINKWGAKTILANIYLNAEVYTGTSQYQACLSQCDDIINSGKYQLDANFSDPFKAKNENSNENIFVIAFDDIYGTGFNAYHVTLHSANKRTFNTADSPYGAGCYKAVPQFIDTYDSEDTRLKSTWLSGIQYASDGTVLTGAYESKNKPLDFVNSMPDGLYTAEADGYRFNKYEIPLGSKTNLSNDWVLFRYAQVYMMKAECLLRTGDASGAGVLVSQVRQRAFKSTNPAKATVTGSDLLGKSSYVYGNVANYILTPQASSFPEQFGRFYDELGWEFAGEMFRRRDMIRFGHYTKAEWLSHKPSEAYRTIFPIPQTVLNTNPDLKQNSNYN